jgi:archaellum biogenesis ATPase FlaH
MKDLSALHTAPLPKLHAWIEGGILPKGSFFLFGGETGVGKTFFILNLVRSLLQKTPFLGRKEFVITESPKKILWLDAECGEYEIARRAKKVFVDENIPPHAIDVYTDTATLCRLDSQDARGEFVSIIKKCEPLPDIIIIDPVSYFMHGSDSDTTQVRNLYGTLRYAKEALKLPDLTFILSHHFRKKPTGRPRTDHDPLDPENFRGAIEWLNHAWCAAQLAWAKDRPLRYNPDKGWDIRARFGKVRGAEPISDDQYYTIDGKTLRIAPGKDPESTWGS